MHSNVILGERLNHLMVGGPVGVVVFGEGFAIQLDNTHSVDRVDQKVEELISARSVDNGIASSLVLVVPPVWNAARSQVVVDVHAKQLAVVLLTGVGRGGGEEGGQQQQVQREALHVFF